jgi:hypothetical protein
MRRATFQSFVCSAIAVAMLIATSQYLAHFHIPQSRAAAVDVEGGNHAGQHDAGQHDAGQKHCSLCLQFDRLPAPPAAPLLPVAYFFLVATLEAERLERIALETPQLWPPSRGPPHLA